MEKNTLLFDPRDYQKRIIANQWVAPKMLQKALFEFIPPASHLIVLDIGVGDGAATLPYLEAGSCVIGMDSSLAMLKALEEKPLGFHSLIQHDINDSFGRLKIPDNFFDIIVACGVLHFSRNLFSCLQQIKKLITLGGFLAFTTIPPQSSFFSQYTTTRKTDDVIDWVTALGFDICHQQKFIAYHEKGIKDSAVTYELFIVRCCQAKSTLPDKVLRNITRSSCVDRKRLFTLVSQPLIFGVRGMAMTTSKKMLAEDCQRMISHSYRLLKNKREISIENIFLPQVAIQNPVNNIGCDLLVIVAHPDDESLFFSGIISSIIKAGGTVHLAVVTDGSGGRGNIQEMGKHRLKELDEAAKILGITCIECFGFKDFGKYHDSHKIIPVTLSDTLQKWGLDNLLSYCVQCIRRHRPRRILSFHPQADPGYSLHGHHLATGYAVMMAYHLAGDASSYCSHQQLKPWLVEEHLTVIPANHHRSEDFAIPVNSDLQQKALRKYKSQQYSIKSFLSKNDLISTGDSMDWIRRFQWYQSKSLAISQALSNDVYQEINWHEKQKQRLDNIFPREELVSLLLEQAAYWKSSENTIQNIKKISEPSSVVVVAGQQTGFLGGPLFSLYKAVSAIVLAKKLNQQGIKAVPLFWMASHDHDIDEITNLTILSKNAARPIHYKLSAVFDKRPVGGKKIGRAAMPTIEKIFQEIKDLPFSYQARKLCQEFYLPNLTFSCAFARLYSYIFSNDGLIFLDPSTKSFAKLAAPIIEKQLKYNKITNQALKSARKRLFSLGKSEVINTRRDVLPVFFHDDYGVRQRLALQEGKIIQVNNGQILNDWPTMLAQFPERFSPSAILRPLIQDTVLPTIATVLGPKEKQYFLQLPELYQSYNQSMPALIDRYRFHVLDGLRSNELAHAGGAKKLLCSKNGQRLIAFNKLPKTRQSIIIQLENYQQALITIIDKVLCGNFMINKSFETIVVEIERILVKLQEDPLICSQKKWQKRVVNLCQNLDKNKRQFNEGLELNNRKFLTRSLNIICRRLKRIIHQLIYSEKRQNKKTFEAWHYLNPRNKNQERVLTTIEFIASHGLEGIKQLSATVEKDNTIEWLITFYKSDHK